MFVRLRWFTLGAAATVAGGIIGATKLKRARQSLTAHNAARLGARGVAGIIERVADSVTPSEHGPRR